MDISSNKKKFFIGLSILSVLYFILRLGTLGHLLMWDEAWNILSLRAFILGDTKNPFYWFYHYHPPLYMLFGQILQPFKAGFHLRLETLSLFFSYLTFITVYALSYRIAGLKYAALTGLFLCLMPFSIAYDTWIKRDCLAILLGYLSLYLLMRRKHTWCAVALGLSLLSKENGVFFILTSFLIMGITREKDALRNIIKMSLVIFLVSSWWYLFFSRMTVHGGRFFTPGTEYSAIWANSPFYFFAKLLTDLGPGILASLIIGAAFIIYRSFFLKQTKWLTPLSVFLSVYVPISFILVLKAPWMALPAGPAMAMIAAAGALFIYELAKKHKVFVLLLAVLIAGAVYSGVSFSYPSYHMRTYPNGWPGANSSRDLAIYLNDNMQPGDRMAITEFEYWAQPYCPVFDYYCGHQPVMIISPDRSLDSLLDAIKTGKISWLVIVDSPVRESGTRKLAENVRDSLRKDPKKVGWAYVWNVEELWKDKK